VPQAEGVKNEAFAEWMRPAALPRVWKNYGWLAYELPAGQMLQVIIQSSFPIPDGSSKAFVITEFGSLGGRHSTFAISVLIGSGLSVLLGFIALIIGLFCPQGSYYQRLVQHQIEGSRTDDDLCLIGERGMDGV